MKMGSSGIALLILTSLLAYTVVVFATSSEPTRTTQTVQEAQALAQRITQQTSQKPLMAEEVFKNVQVLKGIPVNEFMDTMGFFAASLGLNCVYCHVPESLENWERFADDVPRKRTARSMILMVNEINKTRFGGRRALTCYSCHRGAETPRVIPSLADQYGIPSEDPNLVEIVPDAPKGPTAEEVIDRYVQAAGGAQRLSNLTTFVGRGTYEGYDTYHGFAFRSGSELENVFERELQDARTSVTAGDPAKLAAAQCDVWITKTKTVRYIKCLHTKLHLLTFNDLKFPRYSLGPVPESRSPHAADAHASTWTAFVSNA